MYSYAFWLQNSAAHHHFNELTFQYISICPSAFWWFCFMYIFFLIRNKFTFVEKVLLCIQTATCMAWEHWCRTRLTSTCIFFLWFSASEKKKIAISSLIILSFTVDNAWSREASAELFFRRKKKIWLLIRFYWLSHTFYFWFALNLYIQWCFVEFGCRSRRNLVVCGDGLMVFKTIRKSCPFFSADICLPWTLFNE